MSVVQMNLSLRWQIGQCICLLARSASGKLDLDLL